MCLITGTRKPPVMDPFDYVHGSRPATRRGTLHS